MAIWITRQLSDADINLARELQLELDVRPLVSAVPRLWTQILTYTPELWDLLTAVTAVAFTSQQAVDALLGGEPQQERTRLLEILRRKPVYTVGERTADALDAWGIMARFPEDYNATTMARMMINDGVHTAVLHFCGDVRRPELTEALAAARITVHPVVVYEKQPANFRADFAGHDELNQHVASLQAVAFYSPSAVTVFFDAALQHHFRGTYFVIGTTTATALQAFGISAEMPRVPTSELLLRFMAKRLHDPNYRHSITP